MSLNNRLESVAGIIDYLHITCDVIQERNIGIIKVDNVIAIAADSNIYKNG